MTQINIPKNVMRLMIASACFLGHHGASVAGDIAYGQYLASECVTCHQVSGKVDGIPSVVGWPPDHFTAVLNSYRTKERAHAAMQAIASRLSDQDVAALAAYFGSIKNE